MSKAPLEPLARRLRNRGMALKAAGPFVQMKEGPELVEDTAAFLVELAARVDALTPYVGEGADHGGA